MKIFKLLIYILPIIFLSQSCEKDRTDYSYKGEMFLQFDNRYYEIMEDRGAVSLQILLSSPAKESVTVTVKISSTEAIEGVDYEYNGPDEIIFQPGESSKSIIVNIIDNLDPESDKIIKAEITGNSGGYINGFPGPDQLNKSVDIIVMENDCPLTTSLFNGPVVGYEDCQWWTGSPYTYNVVSQSISEDGNILRLTISGFFGVQFYVSYAWYTTKVADENPVEIVFDLTDRTNPVYSIAAGQKCMANITDPWFVPDYILMKGMTNMPLTIDVCKKTFDITYQVVSPTLTWEDGVNHTIHFRF